MHTVLSSATKTITIGPDQPFCIIGERINPTGRKKFQEQLRAGDLSGIEADVIAQVEGGATMLDVNMGAPLIDEADVLAKAVTHDPGPDRPAAVHRLVRRRGARGRAGRLPGQGPGQLDHCRDRADGPHPAAGQALRGGHHRPAERRDRDPRGSAPPARAGREDRRLRDVASTASPSRTSSSIRSPCPSEPTRRWSSAPSRRSPSSRSTFGVNTTLGASNVSFGMPDRHTLNSVFLPMAMAAGLTSAIMDSRTPQIVSAVRAADLMNGNDEWGSSWIAAHRARQAASAAAAASVARPRDMDAPQQPRRRSTRTTARRWCASTCPSSRRARASGCPRASPCSTPRAGTGSPSTRRAAGTAPARSARSRYSRATCRSDASTRGPSTPSSSNDGWRLACIANATCDLLVHVPPLTTRPKAATVGVGRQVILRPSVVKRHITMTDPYPLGPAIGRPAGARRADRPDREDRSARRCATLPGILRGGGLRRDGGRRRRPARGRRARRHDGPALRHRLRSRHHHRRRHPARPVDRHAHGCLVDAEQAAAVRRRRHQPHQRHHARPGRPRQAPAAGPGDSWPAGGRGVRRGRRRSCRDLRGGDRRQRHHDADPARHRPRAARRRALHPGERELPEPARHRAGLHPQPARPRRSCSRRSAPTSAATSSPVPWPPAWIATSACACSSTSARTAS